MANELLLVRMLIYHNNDYFLISCFVYLIISLKISIIKIISSSVDQNLNTVNYENYAGEKFHRFSINRESFTY